MNLSDAIKAARADVHSSNSRCVTSVIDVTTTIRNITIDGAPLSDAGVKIRKDFPRRTGSGVVTPVRNPLHIARDISSWGT
jgi:hypothetical protein